MPRKKRLLEPDPELITEFDEFPSDKDIGTPVLYWHYGQRVGYLEEINRKKSTVKIRPIAPYGRTEKMNCITIVISDIQKIEKE